MFRKIFSLNIVIGLFLITSCDKEKKYASYDMQFQLTNNGAPFSLNNSFVTSDGYEAIVEGLRFYIAELNFTNENEEIVEALEIDLLTFDLDGTTSTNFKLPPGTYKSISFGIGVPSYMNEADPAEYNTIEDHPLNSTNNTYWGWTAMYRFVMLDGRFDLDGDGMNDGLISLHTGYNDMYRTVSFQKTIEAEKKSENTLVFEIEVTDFFDFNDDNKIHIDTENQYHGSQDAADKDLSTRFSNNFSSAISLK